MLHKTNVKNFSRSCHTQSGLLSHLTQVGLAVGDIDSIQQNATLKRLAMQVEFVAEIEESYPRFITRRVYHPSLTVKPNRPTRWKRYVNLSSSKCHREENCTWYYFACRVYLKLKNVPAYETFMPLIMI